MQLSIGFSPCPNDTFMLEALVHGRVGSKHAISWGVHIADVETLNHWALEEKLDVTKMSFGTWLRVQEKYTLLSSGAALGYGCGPLLIAKDPLTEEQVIRGPIAIPGEYTTANLLFSLRYPKAVNKIPMIFSEIESAILDGRAVAGVIIHENRFTYTRRGLTCLLDLGTYWEDLTGSPIPLGAFGIRNALGSDLATVSGSQIRASVEYAFAHREAVMPWVRKHAQEMEDAVMKAHIDTYVNDFSLDLGPEGRLAVDHLYSYASTHGLL
jgi:1,4-dihydroxy-6-naphthoate synthase